MLSLEAELVEVETAKADLEKYTSRIERDNLRLKEESRTAMESLMRQLEISKAEKERLLKELEVTKRSYESLRSEAIRQSLTT